MSNTVISLTEARIEKSIERNQEVINELDLVISLIKQTEETMSYPTYLEAVSRLNRLLEKYNC